MLVEIDHRSVHNQTVQHLILGGTILGMSMSENKGKQANRKAE